MKRFGIILGVIITIMLLVFFLGTSSVKRTSYFQEDYYQKTVARIDSIKSAMVIVNDSMEAGFAKVSITPSLINSEDNYADGKFIQVPLAGFGARKGKSAAGIHDSIFVKAVALKAGQQTLIFVSADLLIMPSNIIDSVLIRLNEKGIQREQLIISATHSHSSLGAWGPGYIGKLFARIGSGCFNAESYTQNRVIGESGTKNNDFSFIIIEQTGYKKAIMGSFSAHATTIGSDNMEISADYPGYWERKIEDTSADYALFFAGSTGSQSPVAKGDGFEKPKYIGEALADSLNVHLSHVELNDKITFSSVSLKIQLPEYHIRITTKINLSSFLSRKLMPQPENVYLQAIRIDNMVWITTPCDFSGEYALQIKNALSAKGFFSNVTSFNGSYIGYIVPDRYFFLNEYETKVMGWFGPNMGEYTMYLIRQISEIVTNTDNI
jgi:neutral ceramidase